MFTDILNIVAPVFLVVMAGYLAVRLKVFTDIQIDHLMRFAIQIAIPCLLFKATSTIDLASAFDWRILSSYYLAAICSFILAYWLLRKIFSRRPGEAVAAAFAALFSNLVLLGLPISELAWGFENMEPGFALVSVNAPICYLLGITAMEYLRADGRGATETVKVIGKAIFKNSLMIGIGLGFLVNFSGLETPAALASAIDLLVRASLPVALFALGGVLTRYALSKSIGEAGMISLLSLGLQPAATWWLALQFNLDDSVTRSIVLMAAMAPGLNAYLFASMYQRSLDTASSTVLLSTVLSVFSVSAWLIVLRSFI
ncbi:MAG: AEC family transporter [Gammaproteobacteria bacterium]|nr:AEC family transporter [Gammaproteobacteria bacterium]